MILVIWILNGVVLALILAVLWLARAVMRERSEVAKLRNVDEELLVYDIPDGQDVVKVMAALDRAGYPTMGDVAEGSRRVLVACPDGRSADRSCVRAVIGAVGTSAGVDVQFADERHHRIP